MTEWLHYCEKKTPYFDFGPAINSCEEKINGQLWVENIEYASQVNYCPFCGYAAKVKFTERDDNDIRYLYNQSSR